MRKRTLVVLGSVFLLAACGGAEPEATPQIPTLTTPAAAASATPPAGAPVIRPDTTWDEQRVMQQPFMRCLQEKGMRLTTDEKGLLDLDPGAPGNQRLTSRDDPAYADCQKLWPVLAPELDETKNPYWADDNENYHKCLVAGGKPLVKENGEWKVGPGFDTWEPDEAMEMECQATAFDGRKG
ncbi:hypothetical protein ACIA8K_14480 [Catenuloplanes sp. NPDC051500]|uniref:hypothetical protein n=1 Tax=Catenuloplanes sp. NPDC051500 TaxID=3363959 RepID=UPI0037A6F22C